MISDLQKASQSGATTLPSRDIPMNTNNITQDEQIQPNYIPNDNQDFKVFKTGANLLRRTSGDKIVHKIFKESIESYRHYIENKDEKFFLQHTYDEVELDDSFDLNQLVKKLKGLWKELPDAEKEKIWGYFTLLLKFSDKLSM